MSSFLAATGAANAVISCIRIVSFITAVICATIGPMFYFHPIIEIDNFSDFHPIKLSTRVVA